MTRTPHRHAELIKAWADGAEIEVKCADGTWHPRPEPIWQVELEYRIKPEPKPDYWIKNVIKRPYPDGSHRFNDYGTNLIDIIQITYSGETGEPLKVEICK